MKVAIIGSGNVGSALERGLSHTAHQVKVAGHDARAVHDTAAWAEIVVLAVPFAAIDATIQELGGAADGKTTIDVTNPLDANMQLALGFTTSAAEEIQRKLPNAHVAKAFNTVFAQHMDSGQVKGQRLTCFVAGDDPSAKRQAMQLAKDIGFDAIDAGPLKNARWIESIGYLNIQLGYALNMGRDIGFELIH